MSRSSSMSASLNLVSLSIPAIASMLSVEDDPLSLLIRAEDGEEDAEMRVYNATVFGDDDPFLT
jgi:hypothetical protein